MANRNISLGHVSIIFNLHCIRVENMDPADRPPLSEVREWDNATGREINRLCATVPGFKNYWYKVMRGEKPFASAYARAILSYDQEIIARVPNNGPLVADLAERQRNARRSWILGAILFISSLLVVAFAAGQRLSSGAGLSDLSSETQSVPMPSETQSTPMAAAATEKDQADARIANLELQVEELQMLVQNSTTY